MMKTVDLIIRAATAFYKELKADKNGRYRSWEYCYKRFHDARSDGKADLDYLSLQLAFYLASWGMYRGSSFLLQKDYKVHIPVVKEILKKDYDCLFGLECSALKEKAVQNRLMSISKFMTDYYDDIRKQVKESEVKNKLSATLITKIFMGTLGCVLAYDRYFIDGVKDQKITTGNYNINSLLKLVEFYEANNKELEKTRKNLKVWACYLHACIKQIQGEQLTNSSLRQRFGLMESSSGSVSRLIKEAVAKELIKPLDPTTAPRYMKYIPIWA